MASAERRATYAANCFGQHFRMPPNSSDHRSPVSKNLESDQAPNNSIDDHTHAKSGCTQHNPSSDRLPGMKWWLHTKSNLGGKANYTCEHLNSWESELSAVYAGFVGESVKVVGDRSINDFDDLSYIGSANTPLEQSWHVPPTCMKSNNSKMPKTEASLNSDLHLTPKKKDQEELCFLDGHFMDCGIADFSVSDQGKMTSSDLESRLIGAEKTEPWWRTSGKDELASLVAQKSLKHIENCDLPQPQGKHISQRPLYTKRVDHDKNQPSSLDQKAKTVSSNVNSCTSGTPTSGCSFQDSNMHFSSSQTQSKDSCSSSEDSRTNSEKSSMSELLEALCHSQTRAREAEKAAQQACSEKEHILSLFFRQASLLFAYKQWFHMLQLENLCLQLRNKNQPPLNLIPECREMQLKKSRGRNRKRKSSSCSHRKCGIRKCVFAFAVGLGLAGAGLLLGWTMGWMLPPL